MNILDIVNRLDREDKNLKCDPDWSAIAGYFDINLSWSDDKRLVAYYLTPWYCTDSYVGLRAYFLDDCFIGTSMQGGRKCDEDFKFCPSSVEKIRKYLQSLVNEEARSVPLLNVNEDIGEDYYTVEFGGQLLPQFHKIAMYQGREVIVKEVDRGYDCFHVVKIDDSGTEKYVDVRKLKFKAGVSYGSNHSFGKIKLDRETQKTYENKD